jgi:hypothetical protein
MPEMAKPGAPTPVVSGIETLPNVPTLGMPTEGAKVGVVSVKGRAVPRVLTIGGPVTGILANGGSFPPYSMTAANRSAVQCGLTDSLLVQALGGSALMRMACVLEYGSGSCLQRVFFDWRPGSYNLPPCEFARVSALPWGTDWPLGKHSVLASIAEGELQDAAQPICSGTGQLLAGAARLFTTPANALFFDVANSDDAGALPLIIADQGAYAIRNYSTGQFIPGWTPVDAPMPGQILRVRSSVDAYVTLAWTLQL